jgi:hypothetical protein
MSKPVQVLDRDAEVEEIVNIRATAVVVAQDTGMPLEHKAGVTGQKATQEAGYTMLRSRFKLRSLVTSEARCRASSTFTAVNFSP